MGTNTYNKLQSSNARCILFIYIPSITPKEIYSGVSSTTQKFTNLATLILWSYVYKVSITRESHAAA